MAESLPLVAAEDATSKIGRARIEWILGAPLASCAALFARAFDSAPLFDAGVAAACASVFGWRGFVAALAGIAMASASTGATTSGVAASLASALAASLFVAWCRGTWQARARFRSRAVETTLVAGSAGALAGAITASIVDSAEHVFGLVLAAWAGLLATEPLLRELLADAHDRSRRTLVSIGVAGVLALVAHVAEPALDAQIATGIALTVAAALAIAGVLAGARDRLPVGLALVALAAAITAWVSPLGASLGLVATVPLLLAIGYSEREMARLRASQAAGQTAFDALMRFLPIGIFRVTIDGAVRYANPTFQNLTGLAGDSLANWRDALPARDHARVDAAWRRFQHGTTPFDEAFWVETGGVSRWLSVRISPEYEHGELAGYIGTVADLTAQRLSDEARSRSDAQWRAVVDNAVDAIATIDSSGIVLSFNRAAYRMFGYSPDEIIGHNVSLLMPEPHRSAHDGYIARYLRTGDPRIIGIGRELEAVRKDGTRLPIHLAVSEVLVDGQRTFTGIMRDISLERAAQEEIRRHNEHLSVTVRNAPMGIVTYRFGEKFTSTNRAFETMIGYTDAELSRMDLNMLTVPEDRAELKRLTDEARAGRIEQFELQLTLMHKSGALVHVETHNAITHDRDHVPDMIIAQIEDLTAEIQAKEAERLHQERLTHVARLSTLGEMTAGIAHEINQPLTAISMYAQSGVRMLDAGIPKPERLREALEKLSAQSLRAGAVIDRVQRLVKRQESAFESIDVNELIRDIQRLAESDARVNDIQLELRLANGLPSVSADPIQIQQVVLNLVRNGIDSMRGINCRHGSTVIIATRALGANAVEVAVTDTGTGVADDLAPNLFTPFTTTKPNGMGMGLSICRSIIQAHGGQLSYRNNAEHGATFYFHLPTGHTDED